MNRDVNLPPAATARILVLTLFGIAVLGMFVPSARAAKGETWRLWGKTYTNVRVQEVTPGTVTIFHSGGILQLELDELPMDLQKRFKYDPEKAARWEQEAREELEARLARDERAIGQPPAAPQTAPGPRPNDMPVAPEKVEFQTEVDLRPVYVEKGLFTKNQGRRPSCSIFAVVSALEYENARHNDEAESLSEEFLIWATRQIQPGMPIDDGYHFAEVITALQTYGVAPLDVMPNTFGKKIEDIEPPDEAIAAAGTRRSVIPIWFRPNDPHLIERIVGALNQGKPVIVGVQWPHWRTLETNNLLRDQEPVAGGGHAVTLVGYRSPDRTTEDTTFIFRNSYGQSWGMAGCAFMAASYLKQHLIAALYLNVP